MGNPAERIRLPPQCRSTAGICRPPKGLDERIGDLSLIEKAMRLHSDDHLSGKAALRQLDDTDR